MAIDQLSYPIVATTEGSSLAKPADSITSHAFPEAYLTTQVSDHLTQEILDAFNRERLTPHQVRVVLSRVRHLIDTGEVIARMGSHSGGDTIHRTGCHESAAPHAACEITVS